MAYHQATQEKHLAALDHAMAVGIDLPGLAHFNDTRNTAQIRAAARDARQGGHFLEAAELFELAAHRYPARCGQLAERDIASLQQQAKECRASRA